MAKKYTKRHKKISSSSLEFQARKAWIQHPLWALDPELETHHFCERSSTGVFLAGLAFGRSRVILEDSSVDTVLKETGLELLRIRGVGAWAV